MVTIELLDNHRLASSDKQWVFEKRSEKPNKKDKDGNLTGEYTYKPIGYYSTMSAAVRGCFSYFQLRLDAEGVTEFMNESRELLDKLAYKLTPEFEVIEK